MKNVIKRNGSKERFEKNKIINAVYKASINNQEGADKGLSELIAYEIETMVYSQVKEVSVEEIQNRIDVMLVEAERGDIKESIKRHRNDRNKKRSQGWVMDDLQKTIWQNKYQYKNENFDQWVKRVSGGNKKIGNLIKDRKFLFAGRILANRGLDKEGFKLTYSNCYVIQPPEDNLESIFEAAKKIARISSYGGGVGIDISKLRPTNALVYNSAKTTTGAVSFMDLYSMTTGLIGQRGRRGALMISMDINHPDIEEFIDIKTDLDRVTKANISVKISDEFMKCVESKENFTCRFEVEATGQIIEKEVNAYDMFMKLVKNNWDIAEPGILFWDTISKNHLLSEDKEFSYAGTNPCAEEPLPAGGSCLLGSINLSEFVLFPFTEFAMLDEEGLRYAVRDCIVGLNEVLDEGLKLHPLKEQREAVSNYRQIGLGVMGIADMLIKLNLVYGSDSSIDFCERISNLMLNEAIRQSALLAKEYGPFEKYNKEVIKKSRFYNYNLSDDVKDLVMKYGLRNSQLLTIPPTGTISTMLGISGGIEPIFNLSYTRKTETLHNEDVLYKVYTPIVQEYMKLKDIEEGELTEVFVTAMTLNPEQRVRMQSAWQKNIDASISSTINLPYEATIEDVYSIYMSAWKNGLKGVTVYRDGCRRSGILVNENTNNEAEPKSTIIEVNTEDEMEKFICPECKTEAIIPTGGCGICLQCGHSKCS